MKKLYKNVLSIAILAFGFNTANAQLQTCTESATASGPDSGATTATVTSFTCVPSGFTTAFLTLDATIGGSCTSWYSYDIVVNGTTVATQQCNQTGFDLSPYAPLTSVSIISNDEDNFTDNVNMTLDINFDYYDPSVCQPPVNLVSSVVDNDSVVVVWDEIVTPGGWIIEYAPAGFTPGTGAGTTVNTTDLTDTIGGLAQLTNYEIYIQADCSTDSSVWEGPLAFTTLANCPDVSGITGAVITGDSVSITWTSNGTETMWDYEYGPVGFTSGSGTMVTGVTNTYDTIANLTPGTSYDVYVRSDCGGVDQGAWMGPITLNTTVDNDNPCDAISVTVGTVGNYSNFGSTNTFDPGNSSNKTVWFKFIAPASGRVAIATCGTPYDTELSVFDTLSDCADISQYTEIGYADYNPYGCAGSHPAGIEMCDLTAGEEYLFKIGAWSSSSTEGIFPLLIWDLQYDAGTDTTVNACLGDTVNLAQAISDSYSVTTTTWSYAANPTAILNDTLALTNNFTIGSNSVMHIASNSCMADTAYATVNISQMANTGVAVSPFNGCNTGDVYLMDGLTGTVDAGGTWTYDNGSSAGILSGNVFIASGLNLGSYQFTYTVANGACPSESTQITVDLQNCVGIEESNNTYGIYPNPNNGTFNIESKVDGLTSIEVMDIQGKVVFTSTINMINGVQTEIAIPSIEVGTYLLKVSNNENVTVKTLIIK